MPPDPSLRRMTYRPSKTRLRSVSVVALRLRLLVRRRGQDRLQQRFGDRRGDAAAEAVQLVLDHDCACDLRVLRRGEEDEPRGIDVILVRLRRTRLARDRDAGDLRLRAGAALYDL